jgi:hypothetical protein
MNQKFRKGSGEFLSAKTVSAQGNGIGKQQDNKLVKINDEGCL